MFRLTVLGDIAIDTEAGRENLDTSTRRMLAVLVARRGQPIPPNDLAYEVGIEASALKSWVFRRRQVLGAEVLPKGSRGAPGYRLGIDRADVDAWWLLDRPEHPLDDASDDELLAVLRPGEPFPGVPGTDTDLLGSARREIKQAQRALAIAAIRADRRVVMTGIVELVTELLEADPYDEELAEVNARLRAALYGRRHGLEALHQTRVQLLDAGLSPSHALEALEAGLLDDQGAENRPHGGDLSAAGRAHPPPAGLPASLARLRADPSVPRGEARPSRQPRSGATWIVVPGPSGAGKGSYVAEAAAAAAEAGGTVVHLEPFQFGPEPWFRPFAEAFPDVGGLLDELTQARADIAAFRHGVMVAVHSNVSELAATGPLVLVITQAQRLESEAIEVLWYLVRSPMPDELTVLIAGDTSQPRGLGDSPLVPGEVSAAWESFVDGLAASGDGAIVELPPLDPEQVDRLIRRHHPAIGRNRSMLLALRVCEASAGLPGLAVPLIRTLGRSDTDPEAIRGIDPLRRLVAGLPEQMQSVGAAAAVIGQRFSAAEVVELVGLPKPDVVELLTALYRRDLVVVEPPIGHYRFATIGVAPVFLATAPPEQQLIWHQRAAVLFEDDPARRARHIVALSDGPEAVQALLDAAEANVVRGQHHQAVADYERAIELAGGPLPPRSCVGHVRALDLSGRHTEADRARESAVDRALDEGDHSTALAVLLASWPEAEAFVDPDDQVARLDSIEPDRLDAGEQVLYARHWSRHLTLAGRADEGLEAIERVAGAARTPAGRIDLALATRYAASALRPPANCLQVLDEVRPLLAEVDVARRADVLAHQAIDAYELGSVDRFEQARDELWAIVDQSSPLRRWHALLLDGVRAADLDDSTAAAAHRRAAFEHAVGHGMRHAIGAKLAAELAEQWLLGQPIAAGEDLGPDGIRGLEQNPPILDAGVALLAEASGEHDRALTLAEEVATVAVGHPNRQSAPSVAIVASILARTDQDELRTAAKDLLLRRGDVMVLIGAFVAGLGPATRYAAQLETRRSERRRLDRRARQLAEQARSPRWLRLTEPDT